VHWYNPKTRVAETVPGPYTDEEAKRVAVTRAFGALQDNGCVQLRRRQIYVVDLTALKGLAVGGWPYPAT
jgi:hypothetical protein